MKLVMASVGTGPGKTVFTVTAVPVAISASWQPVLTRTLIPVKTG
ncbi:hypothetical protein HDF26_000996 [Pedobacter cryoconitis]|nr:hypothetical protein [Pedobacter cryoconitis]MBB6270569.1 hypothetical protein [Pedobacter cryoconitis]